MFLNEFLENLSQLNRAFQDPTLNPSDAQIKVSAKMAFFRTRYLGVECFWLSEGMGDAWRQTEMSALEKESFLNGVRTLVRGITC